MQVFLHICAIFLIQDSSGGFFSALPEGVFFCVPREARTLDPLIKSQLLYQLS